MTSSPGPDAKPFEGKFERGCSVGYGYGVFDTSKFAHRLFKENVFIARPAVDFPACHNFGNGVDIVFFKVRPLLVIFCYHRGSDIPSNRFFCKKITSAVSPEYEAPPRFMPH